MISTNTYAHYDIVIIGGGINGAGIARELALRGLKVAVFEKNDFGSGTSSASSKLAHGGLRYLEHGDFSLVFEACRERERLLNNAPHLVKPLSFVLPIYKDSRRPKWQIRIGLWLYDLLSSFKTTKKHRMLTAKETLALEPTLNPKNLVGGALYYDAQMNDARVVLENILEAEYNGAAVHNYTEVIDFEHENGEINAIYLREKNTQHDYRVTADLYINTTGPWSDILRKKINPHSPDNLRLSKGIHIVVPKLTQDNAILLTAKKDGRVFFVIPWNERSLVGTTETDYTGNPDDIVATEEDIEYLLSEIQTIFPTSNLSKQDVISTIVGLRPLAIHTKKTANSTSREHQIIEEGNMIHLLGGKFTTYRKMSEDVAKVVFKMLKKDNFETLTEDRCLWGGRIKDMETHIEQHREHECLIHDLKPALYEHLIRTYGNKYLYIISILNENPNFKNTLKETPYCIGEVIYAIRHQKARTPEDFMRRRTSIYLDYGPNAACKKDIIEIFKTFRK